MSETTNHLQHVDGLELRFVLLLAGSGYGTRAPGPKTQDFAACTKTHHSMASRTLNITRKSQVRAEVAIMVP